MHAFVQSPARARFYAVPVRAGAGVDTTIRLASHPSAWAPRRIDVGVRGAWQRGKPALKPAPSAHAHARPAGAALRARAPARGRRRPAGPAASLSLNSQLRTGPAVARAAVHLARGGPVVSAQLAWAEHAASADLPGGSWRLAAGARLGRGQTTLAGSLAYGRGTALWALRVAPSFGPARRPLAVDVVAAGAHGAVLAFRWQAAGRGAGHLQARGAVHSRRAGVGLRVAWPALAIVPSAVGLVAHGRVRPRLAVRLAFDAQRPGPALHDWAWGVNIEAALHLGGVAPP